jgi:phospholipid-binding lipoprotein MlaA
VRFFVGPGQLINDDIVRWTYYIVGGIDVRAQLLDTTSLVEQAALDKYTFIRNAYLQRRRYLVYDGKPPPEPEEE